MIFRVYVNFKKGILDPEAEAIKQTITSMGYKPITNIVKGKFFDIIIDAMSLHLRSICPTRQICIHFSMNFSFGDF